MVGFVIKNEDELRSAFRPEEYETVILPTTMKFPIGASYVVTWPESSGAYQYLVFKHPIKQKLVGLIFRITRGAEGGGMCDWCHSFGAANEIGLMVTSVSAKRSVGTTACFDISCFDKVEMAGKLSRKPFQLLAEELLHRIVNFYDKLLT